MKKMGVYYFLFGWAVILSALSLAISSTEVLLLFLVLAGVVFVLAQTSRRNKPVGRAQRIQTLSSNSVQRNASGSRYVNVHR